MIKQEIANLIKKSVKNIEKKYTLDEIPDFVIERPKDEKFGDYSTNAAIILGKKMGKNPMEIGKELISQLNKNGDADCCFYFERIELAMPGFINFTLSEKFLQNYLLEIQNKKKKLEYKKIGKGKTIVIDYSAPNIAKPMHIGHLRSTIIGHALYNIG